MPTYTYACGVCRARVDAVRRIDDRDNAPECHRMPMTRQIVPTMVSVFSPYKTAAIDKDAGERIVIKNRAEHEAFLRRNGYEEVGNDKSMAPPPPEQIAENRARALKEQGDSQFTWSDPDV